jgi:outer membrane protein assembly factor BamA
MRISEGQLFSRRDFLVSSRKIAQLGFFELDGDPVITPVPGTNEVDVKVRGKEVGRNEIQFGGGYSGVDGFFATFSFFSRNFLGRGSSFSVSGQFGGETTRYSLSYVEPYFLRTKSSLGGSVFARQQQFSGFDRDGKGGSIFWSYPTSTFSYFRTTASFENSQITGRRAGITDDDFTTYSLTPSYTFDNRDNPLRPTRGRRLNFDLEVGASRDNNPDYPSPFKDISDVNFLKPSAGITQYFRTFKKHYVGIHAEAGFLTPFSGNADSPHPEDGVDAPYLPVFERFFLGGERSIRGVETRSVGPQLRHYQKHQGLTDCNGNGTFYTDPANPVTPEPGEGMNQYCPGFDDKDLVDNLAIGGDAYWLVNLEYSIPFSSIFEATAFVDVGNSFGVNHIDLFDLVDANLGDRVTVTDSDPFAAKATAGVELRFHTPVLQQPLRLIYGCKVFGDFSDDAGTCDFQFSIGRTFQ